MWSNLRINRWLILGWKKGSGIFNQTEQVINKDKFKTNGSDAAKVDFKGIWNTQYMGPRTYESNLLSAHLDTGVWPH